MDPTTVNAASGIDRSKVATRADLSIRRTSSGQPRSNSTIEDTGEPSTAETGLPRANVELCLQVAPGLFEIHAEIKADTFLTPKRLDGTVQGLLDVLG